MVRKGIPYPWNEPDSRMEYTSFINIRPMDNNTSMEVMDEAIRERIRIIVETCLLAPDETIEKSS